VIICRWQSTIRHQASSGFGHDRLMQRLRLSRIDRFRNLRVAGVLLLQGTRRELSTTDARRVIERVSRMLNCGKWYDPISERWVEPRETRSQGVLNQSGSEHIQDRQRKAETQRIWRALVDCCARD
jgi:hypothetical protein